MRSSLVTSKSRELSGLCAACARKRLARPTSALRTASAPVVASRRTHSSSTRTATPTSFTRPTVSASPISTTRRCLSSSPWRAQDKKTDTATDPDEQPAQAAPKIDYKPLPYYALFPQTLPDGPPPTGPFDIDVRALRREFLQLQAASHPDFYHDASSSSFSSSSSSSSAAANHAAAQEAKAAQSTSRRKAEALSSHINSAYKTLSSPLARAQYVLAERYGIDLAGDEASSLTGPPDAELLTEVLYARETIEEAGSERDLDGVRAENDARIEACLRGLAGAFAREDVPAAVRETVRLRYWENIKESVHNWEEGKPIVLQH